MTEYTGTGMSKIFQCVECRNNFLGTAPSSLYCTSCLIVGLNKMQSLIESLKNVDQFILSLSYTVSSHEEKILMTKYIRHFAHFLLSKLES